MDDLGKDYNWRDGFRVGTFRTCGSSRSGVLRTGIFYMVVSEDFHYL